MKKLINKVEDVVRESVQGLVLAHPDLLALSLDPCYVYSRYILKDKVTLISGGGSGHEPLHAGFVGKGMLAAACPGEVFTSPVPDQMLAAAKQVNSGGGTLFLIKNYTGDVMNFELAAELADAEGLKITTALIDDDVAIKDSLYTAGRRGVAGTFIVEKIVGAAADLGYDLEQCKELAKKVNQNTRSMGLALTSCSTPAAGKPTFDISDDEIEIGIGIHGEPGRRRVKMQSADELTEQLLVEIFNDVEYERESREWDWRNHQWKDIKLVNKPLAQNDEVIVLVNSMGGTPISELYIIYRKIYEMCEQSNVKIARCLVGPYVTSLEMQGVSITVTKADAEMLKLWDAPCNTPAYKHF